VGWLCSLFIVLFCWYQTGSPGLCLAVAFAAAPGYYSLMVFDYLLIDYHFLNAFFIQLWIILAAIFCRSKQSLILIFSGIVTALFLTTWQASPLFYLFASLYGLFLFFSRSKISGAYNEYISTSLIIGSVLAGIILFPKTEIRFGIEGFNYFHVTTVLVAGLFFKFVDYLSFNRRVEFKKLTILIVFLGIIISLAMWGIFDNQILYGVSFLTANEPMMSTISELQTIFSPNKILVKPQALFKSFVFLGPGLLLLPLIYIFNPRKIFNGSGKIILHWFIIISFLSIYSIRFVRWLGALPSLFNGCAVYLIVIYVKDKINSRSESLKNKEVAKVAIACLPYMFIIFLLSFAIFFNNKRNISKNKIESFNWISKNTPQTAGYRDSGEPEYGILCYWDEGNAIAYYARRPVLVGNNLRGYKKMAQIFSAQSEKEAVAYLKKYKARYVYLRDRSINDRTIDIMHIYKNLPNSPVDRFSHAYGKKARKNKNHLYIDSFHHWLSQQAAIKPSGNFLQPTSYLRIVYSSSQENRFVPPEILLYEFVPGCEIKGVVDPNTKVALSIGCRFDKVKQLYKRQVQSDADGSFSIRVPYSCKYYKGRVETEEFYKISFYQNNKLHKAKLIVSNEDVIQGKQLEVEQNIIPVNLE
jgi:hypothetical protein